MHERRIAADEINADGARRFVYGVCERQKISLPPRAFHNLRDGRQRDALVGDEYAYLVAYLVDGLDQPPGGALYLLARALRSPLYGIGRAVAQGESERHSAYVQML